MKKTIPQNTPLTHQHKLIKKPWLSLFILLLSFPFLAHSATVSTGRILAYETMTITAPSTDQRQSLPIQAYGQQLLLDIEDNQTLFAHLSTDEKQRIHSGGNRYFRGQLVDEDDSWVRLSWVNGLWRGGYFDGHELFLIDSAKDVADLLTTPAPADAETLIYRLSDLRLPQLFGAEPLATDKHEQGLGYQAFSDHLNTLLRGADTIDQLPLTIVSDVDFTGDHGANAAAVIATRLNFIDGIYSNQVGVAIGLFHHETLTNNGTLTSTDPQTLLNQFRVFMTSGAGSGIPKGGLNHLFTGRNLNGNVVGIAYLSVLCNNSFSYGVDQSLNSDTSSSLLIAHEMGHNFGAPHDGQGACANEPFRGIMNPSINGTTQFSNCSLQQMADDVANAQCLTPLATTIYADSFEN